MSVEPLLSGQILCVLLERERVELRGYDSRMTWGGPRHNTGEHHGHGNADQDDFAHLTVPLTNAAVSCLSRSCGDLAYQLRRLRDIRRDPPRLVAREQLGLNVRFTLKSGH